MVGCGPALALLARRDARRTRGWVGRCILCVLIKVIGDGLVDAVGEWGWRMDVVYAGADILRYGELLQVRYGR